MDHQDIQPDPPTEEPEHPGDRFARELDEAIARAEQQRLTDTP